MPSILYPFPAMWWWLSPGGSLLSYSIVRVSFVSLTQIWSSKSMKLGQKLQYLVFLLEKEYFKGYFYMAAQHVCSYSIGFKMKAARHVVNCHGPLLPLIHLQLQHPYVGSSVVWVILKPKTSQCIIRRASSLRVHIAIENHSGNWSS